MEISFSVFVVGILSFSLGAVFGAFLFSRISSDQRKTRLLEKHLHDKQDEFKNYQSEVTEHFSESAKMLKHLAESYRDIHNHLAKSSQKLTENPDGVPIIDNIEDNSSQQPDNTETVVSAPLDYAPKNTPFDRGSLADDLHLEKVELSEKPIADFAEAIAENAAKQKQ